MRISYTQTAVCMHGLGWATDFQGRRESVHGASDDNIPVVDRPGNTFPLEPLPT
jgi:hypothetical protein